METNWTVWIHRSSPCDILVYFNTIQEAYSLCVEFLEEYGDDEMPYFDFNSELDDFIDAGCSKFAQLSIHRGKFHHSGWCGLTGWNTRGTVLVSKNEALELGDTEEPSGFIPHESEEGIWVKELSHQLDLDIYTILKRIERQYYIASL